MPPGVALLEAAEGEPILETALIASPLRRMFLFHDVPTISQAQSIPKASFLCPPTCTVILRERMELLLVPAPCDA